MIRIILADDHQLVREGFRAILATADDMEVVGEATDGAEAVELTRSEKPHVVVMDLAMPRLDGEQAARRIATLDLPVAIIILSMYSDPTHIQYLLRSGIKGYLLKDSAGEELIRAVRTVAGGETYLSPAITEPVLSLMMSPNNKESESVKELLTPREREVLQLVAEGLTNAEIAEKLFISVKTVEKHRSNLMSKLNVNNVALLVRVALQHDLIYMKPRRK